MARLMAVDVRPMENYLIIVSYDNGERRIFNCSLLHEDRLFSKIFDKEFFKTVHVDDGLVCWDRATDIEPHFLYENSEDLAHFQLAG